MVEWVEVKGTSVEVAVKAGLEELGIDDAARAEVKVLQEPQRGFLGIGRQDAIVQVKLSPKRSRGGRKRRSSRRSGSRSRQTGNKARPAGARPAKRKGARGRQTGSGRTSSRSSGGVRKEKGDRVVKREVSGVPGDDKAAKDLGEQQAEVVKAFLQGLLGEFGLEGRVETRFDGRVLHADIVGEQTEALIGPKATVMQAVHELTKTVVQRKTARNCRLRLDIAGYGERRRRALSIYAGQLTDQVLEEGGEIMLEPMNAADRKVVHDAVSEVDGIGSYSEGTEPRRSVVISRE